MGRTHTARLSVCGLHIRRSIWAISDASWSPPRRSKTGEADALQSTANCTGCQLQGPLHGQTDILPLFASCGFSWDISALIATLGAH